MAKSPDPTKKPNRLRACWDKHEFKFVSVGLFGVWLVYTIWLVTVIR